MARPTHVLFALLFLFAAACGEAVEPIEIDDSNASANQENANQDSLGVRDYDGPIGGDRPVTAQFPDDYDPAQSYPLLIQLHGFGSNASQTGAFFDTADTAASRGVITLTPEGLVNGDGRRFWNATEMCCDWGNSGVDDVAYLTDLMDEAIEKYAVDPERIYFVGLSNGAFMSHRMACEKSDRIQGIISFNGASFKEPDDCDPSDPVELIHIHSTDDDTVPFDGHNWLPSAQEVVDHWVEWNGCDAEPDDDGRIDLTGAVSGDETTRQSWPNCADGGAVHFWTIEEGSHVPYPLNDFAPTVFDVLGIQ